MLFYLILKKKNSHINKLPFKLEMEMSESLKT